MGAARWAVARLERGELWLVLAGGWRGHVRLDFGDQKNSFAIRRADADEWVEIADHLVGIGIMREDQGRRVLFVPQSHQPANDLGRTSKHLHACLRVAAGMENAIRHPADSMSAVERNETQLALALALVQTLTLAIELGLRAILRAVSVEWRTARKRGHRLGAIVREAQKFKELAIEPDFVAVAEKHDRAYSRARYYAERPQHFEVDTDDLRGMVQGLAEECERLAEVADSER